MTRLRVIQRTEAEIPGGAAKPPMWHECLWPLDWLALHTSPVYFGIGVPRGDGSAVVLVPGFMGTDAYLSELHLWLNRIGYRAYMSGIGLNAECPGRLTERLVRTVERAHAETGRPVRIVGHSLGGIIGRRACIERPELVSQLVYLGSPLQAVHPHPALATAISLLRAALSALSMNAPECLTDRCACGFLRTLGQPLAKSIRHDAVYTRGDGVVDWHDAQELDADLNHEVDGTHIGLVFNPAVYRLLADLLATREQLERAA